MWLIEYFKGIKSELRHVNWPTRRATVIFTIIVIVLSFLAAAYLAFFDLVFNYLLEVILL